ncbi:MAG TPA: hypothetical protein DCY27_13535 [Desulfobacterales bacterium]|nr:hypothetical protein [Desulfobacterales bacterium]
MRLPLKIEWYLDDLRMAAYARLYGGRRSPDPLLYRQARLRYAPGVKMELVPGDIISKCIAYTGAYELPLTRRVAELGRQGGTFIDVGANLGYFSLLWAAAKPGNKCIAFEPSPRNIDILRRNISRNGLESQIEVVPAAAGRSPGKLRFDPGPAEQTGWGGFAAGESPRTIEVDVVRVDQFVPSDAPIALLKVDIEGADAWAIMGCEKMFRAKAVKEIWFEQNKPRIKQLGIPMNAAQEFLGSAGYLPQSHGDPAEDIVDWSATPEETGEK